MLLSPEFPSLKRGQKNSTNTAPFPPSKIEKKLKFPDPTERGEILTTWHTVQLTYSIQVSTVCVFKTRIM